KDYDADIDGLQVYTALDLSADSMAVPALRKGLKEVDKRRGWRGPAASVAGADHELFIKTYNGITPGDAVPGMNYPGMITELVRGVAKVDLGGGSINLDLNEAVWARRYLDRQDRATGIKPDSLLKVGDVIEVSLEKP